ncbi:MAG: T9SS type A sorting domain-containing protein, partial [Candidatus Cloacimonetes bacterium]|nr:T9SS type A sorting domain-containing protein [Candidatus Cloacimonadota bacterium]
WAMPYDGIGVFSMDTTSDGNIILGGRSDSNPALRKITPDAETIWTSIIDTDSGIIFSITQASDYGYLMTGVNYGDNDILVIKTDADGDSLWTRVFDINGENNQGNCIIKTYDNKILCSGSDGFLGKFEQDGEIIFVNNYNSWNIRTCMETIDSNFILFMAAAIMKIDSDGDSLSFSNFQLYQGVPGIYNSIKELEDGCFVLASSHSSSSIFIIKTDAEGYYTDIKEDKIDFINSINLSNYPNPFNPITIISYNFNKEVMKPILEIYNFKGQEVHSVKLEENDKTYVWDGGGYASGIYFYRIKGDNYNSAVQKMILMK